ncbi:MAG: tRNA (adenosine(37)-N6)-dimethylallyltransferase MiaA, partial [Clostridia bacterium]|nr:tRNA (adenosine(37)-N6)-dimethylallyltransferase MiaA [Clostridia bacterium]
SDEELNSAVHHLFDFADPKVSFSCADYIPLASEVVEDILSRGKLPIFCGGTGLYLDRFLSGAEFESTEVDEDFRREMNDFALEFGNEALHQKLREIDPRSADEIHPNNVKRVIRALEIYKTSGRTKSEIDLDSKEFLSKYDALQIGIKYENRELLYDRINLRVDKMMQAGLLDETRELLENGIFEANATAAQAIGYKELLSYFNNEKTLISAVEDLKMATRRYAKRQMTWFSSHGNVNWLVADDKTPNELADEAEQIIKEFI